MDVFFHHSGTENTEIHREYLVYPKALVWVFSSPIFLCVSLSLVSNTLPMKDPDIEKLLQDGQGYNLNLAHVLEFLMARTIANSFLSSEILRRQIELEQLIQNGTV